MLPVEFVAVVSRQRSSSTFLCNSIASLLRETVSGVQVFDVGEPWTNGEMNAKYDSLVGTTHVQRMADPLAFIRALRGALCKTVPHAKRCLLAFKLFDVHFTNYELKQEWYDHIKLHQLLPLFSHPGGRMVILERDPVGEYCSLQFAQRSQQWFLPTTPQSVRDSYAAFRKANCENVSASNPEAFRGFKSPTWSDLLHHHTSWFNLVHHAIRSAPGGAERSVNASYADNVQRHEELISRVKKELVGF